MARILSLRERLLAKLDELAAKGGSFNDLFRPVAEGKIQCPKTGNGVSWTKFITRMCANLPAGTNIGDNKCWKLKYNQWKITEQRSGKTKLLASVLITRFLALLENPTELNLTQLRETKDLPFSHYCAKGLKDSAGRYCVNGIEHGAITTRTENESRKKNVLLEPVVSANMFLNVFLFMISEVSSHASCVLRMFLSVNV